VSAHVDILDQHDRLGRPFVGSIVFHVGLVLLAAGVTFVQHHSDFKLGDDKGGGGLGGVVVVKVTDIRLPNPGGPQNPVANDTASEVPTPPPVKAPPKVAEKAPSPNAIPIPTKNAPKTATKPSWYHPELANNKFRDKQKFNANQVYSVEGQHVTNPNMNLPAGVGLGGGNSPFGSQFGAYAGIIQNKVALAWKKPGSTAAGTPRCTVSFTLHRDGSVSDIKVTQPSGVSQLDFSGQRAILDAAPFPAFPAGLNKTEVGIDFVFELSR
jgi:protein TonB